MNENNFNLKTCMDRDNGMCEIRFTESQQWVSAKIAGRPLNDNPGYGYGWPVYVSGRLCQAPRDGIRNLPDYAPSPPLRVVLRLDSHDLEQLENPRDGLSSVFVYRPGHKHLLDTDPGDKYFVVDLSGNWCKAMKLARDQIMTLDPEKRNVATPAVIDALDAVIVQMSAKPNHQDAKDAKQGAE